MPMFHRFMENTVDSENIDLSKLLQSKQPFRYTPSVYIKTQKMEKNVREKDTIFYVEHSEGGKGIIIQKFKVYQVIWK